MQSTPDTFSGSSIGGWLAASPSVRPPEPSRVCLDGSLDDLPIQDVLQILALGRKTGYLALETGVGVGALVFRQGQVVASIHDGDGGPLPAADGVSSSEAERDALIRERITAFLHRLAWCRQGAFTFVASPHSPLVIHGRDVAREALRQGIDVIELLLEMACRVEEGVHDEPAWPGAAPSVLLVDDEEMVRRVLSRCLVEGGYRVVEADDVESAVKRGKALAAAGVQFVLLTNLNMRGASRDSDRGGVEVIQRLEGLRPRPPVVMMAGSERWSLSARTMRRVSRVVIWPGLSRLDPDELAADIRTLAGRMVQEVLPQVCGTVLA
jgi:CheY-like chemotaxis protein